jgi:predicted metal-binding membrane protein
MDAVTAPGLKPWSPADFAFAFVMWAVMMVGMMTPSAAPMILIYARVGRHAAAQGRPLAAVGWFVAGYLLAWTGFSILATIGQWGLTRAALITPMMASASGIFGGLVLVAAGIYQWTPLKDICLNHCQTPLTFIQRHGGFRRNVAGSLGIGFRHGIYCIGCCWALMGLLFVGGVMNVLWIAGLTIFVLAEKAVPVGRLLARLAGLGFIAWGMWLLALQPQ